MRAIDPRIVAHLRSLVREDRSVSHALKTLHGMLPSDQRNMVAIIDYAKEAFCLTLHEASPIAGWDAEGAGEIPDERLDELLVPAVTAHRSEWDRS